MEFELGVWKKPKLFSRGLKLNLCNLAKILKPILLFRDLTLNLCNLREVLKIYTIF